MKKEYSAEEKRAYYIGVGAALGAAQKRSQVKQMAAGMSEKARKSYWNGVNDSLMTRAWTTGGKIKRK